MNDATSRNDAWPLCRCLLACALACAGTPVRADPLAWFPARDQNPFVLGAGIPLQPQAPQQPGTWQTDVYVAEANSQLISRSADARVVFGAETRESRVGVSYALDEHWSLRASAGEAWLGGGFLNGAIRRFHDLIGAPQGARGRLGVALPFVQVSSGGEVLYRLDAAAQGAAPLLLDAIRTWSSAPDRTWGLAFGAKLPVGGSRRLGDNGAYGWSVSAFADLPLFGAARFGARVGGLHVDGAELLATLARSDVPFGGVYVHAPLFGQWSAQLQYDAHGALYRNVPGFLGEAGVLTVGVAHPLGRDTQLMLGLSEDVPVGHTQDVVLQVAFENGFGGG